MLCEDYRGCAPVVVAARFETKSPTTDLRISPLKSHRRLALRAVTAFLLLPGIVGYLIPVVIGRAGHGSDPLLAGMVLIVASSLLLGWCVVEFYRAGKGTLAPWAPPRRLVVSGPYRWSRNPMYVAVVTLTIGWALWFRSWQLLLYTSVLALAFHLRIKLYEEPRLATAFPEWSDIAPVCGVGCRMYSEAHGWPSNVAGEAVGRAGLLCRSWTRFV